MLLLQLAAAADTLIVRQVPPIRTGFEQFTSVVSGLTSILALILIGVTIVLLLSMRAKAEETRVRLDELLDALRPLTQNANALVKDVGEIVERSRETIQHADTRVRKSVDVLMDRVDDVSELIGRIHASAGRVESVATTTVAGIRFGARALGLSKRKAKKQAAKHGPVERPRLRRRD